MILAGVILAEAAAVYDGLNAVQTQSYGPEARGGASRSEVIIARGEIDYPKVMQADVLLCMSQEDCDTFYDRVKEEGCIIVDSTHVSRLPSQRAIALPITKIARDATGRGITASIVALGVLTGLTRYSRVFNLTGLPAVSIPCGFTSGNLPVGLQLVGNLYDEVTVLQAAYAYEQATGWHLRRPPLP